MEFDAHGARLTHPDGKVGFKLSGYGYGDKLKSPAAAKLAGDATRLEYRRVDFTEWYVNGRQGLEQGFTLAKKPSGASKGQPLTIALSVTGDLTLSQQQGAVLLNSGKTTVLRYAGLSAIDAHGRNLPAHLEAGNHVIRLVVDDRQAQYPVTVDPTWTQQAELTSSDGAAEDNFGFSVAVSGKIAVIGAYGHNNYQGSAYVYVQSGTTWTQQAELTSTDGAAYDEFGYSVAVNGTTAVIGAPYHGNIEQGSAYVFVQSGTTWTQQAELTASDGASHDEFGYSVAVSGTTAVIGAPLHKVGGNLQQGAAYVYVQSGSTWTQQAELTSSDGEALDNFGNSVAVSGTTAVIGAPNYNNYQGSAYVYEQSGTTWTQQQELTASDGAGGDNFGYAAAVSDSRVVVGAPYHQVGSNAQQGAAYVFVQPAASLSIAATHSSPIYQSGPGTLTLTVTNTGPATAGTATVTDTVDTSNLTINSVSTGCVDNSGTVTCTIDAGMTGSTAFNIYVTALSNADASVSNTATLTDSTDTITTASSTDTIPIGTALPVSDSDLTQISISGSTNNGPCADNNDTFTATVQLQNSSALTLTDPYASNITLSGGNTLLSNTANTTSVPLGLFVTFTFDIQLATCNTFTLYFDVAATQIVPPPPPPPPTPGTRFE